MNRKEDKNSKATKITTQGTSILINYKLINETTKPPFKPCGFANRKLLYATTIS